MGWGLEKWVDAGILLASGQFLGPFQGQESDGCSYLMDKVDNIHTVPAILLTVL